LNERIERFIATLVAADLEKTMNSKARTIPVRVADAPERMILVRSKSPINFNQMPPAGRLGLCLACSLHTTTPFAGLEEMNNE